MADIEVTRWSRRGEIISFWPYHRGRILQLLLDNNPQIDPTGYINPAGRVSKLSRATSFLQKKRQRQPPKATKLKIIPEDGSFRFLDLPIDVRNMIYDVFFLSLDGIDITVQNRIQVSSRPTFETALLSTCKKIHKEAANVLCGSNVFRIEGDSRILQLWLWAIGRQNTARLRLLQVHDINASEAQTNTHSYDRFSCVLNMLKHRGVWNNVQVLLFVWCYEPVIRFDKAPSVKGHVMQERRAERDAVREASSIVVRSGWKGMTEVKRVREEEQGVCGEKVMIKLHK